MHLGATSGKVVWKIKVDEPTKSGLVVAGDLVFFGESNGKFRAANARSGQVLWTFNGRHVAHGGGANAAPVAYVVNGVEYIANAFGGNVPDRDFGSPLGDAVIAFRLPAASATGPNIVYADSAP